MQNKEIASKLQQQAKTNPAFSAVCNMLASRDKTRHMISLHALYYKMKKEGFPYSASEYAEVLKFLSELGLGSLEMTKHGRVKALTHIKTTLQAIGSSACSIPKQTANAVAAIHIAEPAQGASKFEVKIKSINLSINGKPLTIQVSEDFAYQEALGLIQRIKTTSL